MATAGTATTHLEDTVELLDKHVKDQSTTGVSNSISSWIKTLGQHKEFKSITADLESLKDAISEKDGKQIVALMTKLGEATTKAAEQAEGGEGEGVKHLGKALSAAAKGLGKLVK